MKIEEIASRLATIKKSLQATDLHTLTLRVEEVEKLIEEYTSQLWTSPCTCPPDEKTGETLCCNNCGRPTARTESKELPGDDEMRDWAEIHAIHCYHDGLTSKKHFVEGYLYAVDFFKNNYASPLLASKDARIRELEEALVQANENIKVWHGDEMYDVYYNNAPEMKKIKKALTPTKN